MCTRTPGEAGPLACLPDAVLAEAVIVAQDDDFARHGGTDAEAVLNLEDQGGGGACHKLDHQPCTRLDKVSPLHQRHFGPDHSLGHRLYTGR